MILAGGMKSAKNLVIYDFSSEFFAFKMNTKVERLLCIFLLRVIISFDLCYTIPF